VGSARGQGHARTIHRFRQQPETLLWVSTPLTLNQSVASFTQSRGRAGCGAPLHCLLVCGARRVTAPATASASASAAASATSLYRRRPSPVRGLPPQPVCVGRARVSRRVDSTSKGGAQRCGGAGGSIVADFGIRAPVAGTRDECTNAPVAGASGEGVRFVGRAPNGDGAGRAFAIPRG